MIGTFGRVLPSTYTGAMAGAGLHVFGVWNYVIAHAVDGLVELNPRILAAMLGCESDKVEEGIAYLCSADSPRLVRVGQWEYRVVNHDKYRQIKSETDRREYNRIKQREYRQREQKLNKMDLGIARMASTDFSRGKKGTAADG